MYEFISLETLRITVVMTHGYLKCCNLSLLIYKIPEFSHLLKKNT